VRVIVDAFLPVLPASVRELLERAPIWMGGMAPLQVTECMRMLNEPRIPSRTIGWIIGMTLFGADPRQQLPAALGRRSFRDDVIPHVLIAFSTGVVKCGQSASPRLWTSIEMLVGRLPEGLRRREGEAARSSGTLAVTAIVSAEAMAAICEALPIALASQHAVVRGCGLRLAFELGEQARTAIEAVATGSRVLGEALIALAGGEPPVANTDEAALLASLLEAWRTTHDPAVERAIARIGANLSRVRGPIAARSHGELEGTWHAVAAKRDPIDVTRLLELKFPAHWKRAIARARQLAEFSPDPRISIRLADIARTYTSRSSRPLHDVIGRILADAPTASAMPGLEAVVTSHAEAYRRAREAIAATAVYPVDPALLTRAGGEGPDVDALSAQHTANPGDLEARMVLADALQAAGDPRGELIMLQIAIADGTASAGATRRVTTLLQNHADEWTGPLPAIEGPRFERGFLVACETGADNAAIARTLERPEWRTIEELSLRANDVELVQLFARLPLLRRLCADGRGFEQLAAASRSPITRLEVAFVRSPSSHVFSRPAPEMFPGLRVLGGCWFSERWDVAAYREQLSAAREAGLHAIVHTGFPRNHLAAAASYANGGPPEIRFTLARHRWGFDPLGWRVRIRRDQPVIEAAWTYHRWGDNVVAELFEALAAARVPRIAVHVPEMLRVHLERLIRDRPFGIEVAPGAPIDLTATG